jgi:hypothetical protein
VGLDGRIVLGLGDLGGGGLIVVDARRGGCTGGLELCSIALGGAADDVGFGAGAAGFGGGCIDLSPVDSPKDARRRGLIGGFGASFVDSGGAIWDDIGRGAGGVGFVTGAFVFSSLSPSREARRGGCTGGFVDFFGEGGRGGLGTRVEAEDTGRGRGETGRLTTFFCNGVAFCSNIPTSEDVGGILETSGRLS